MNPIRETWQSADGQHRILWGDCLEILPTLDTSEVAAVLADPPYGIGEARRNHQSRGWHPGRKVRTNSPGPTGTDYGKSDWDDKPADRQIIDRLSGGKYKAIIWGGNFFHLPPSSCWLVWDKENGTSDFADCELAWTNLSCAVRKFRWRWCGMIQEQQDKRRAEKRLHPTQKPLPLIEWCLSFLPPGLILDPFAGSCTVAVACARTGRRSISIEIEERYFRIGIERMEREAARFPLLTPRSVQKELTL
jgi:DNA modification methylase